VKIYVFLRPFSITILQIHFTFIVFGLTANFAYRLPLLHWVVVINLTVEYPRFGMVLGVNVENLE
jgi:hypothetical protein